MLKPTTLLFVSALATTSAVCPGSCTSALLNEAQKLDMMKYVSIAYTCDVLGLWAFAITRGDTPTGSASPTGSAWQRL